MKIKLIRNLTLLLVAICVCTVLSANTAFAYWASWIYTDDPISIAGSEDGRGYSSSIFPGKSYTNPQGDTLMISDNWTLYQDETVTWYGQIHPAQVTFNDGVYGTVEIDKLQLYFDHIDPQGYYHYKRTQEYLNVASNSPTTFIDWKIDYWVAFKPGEPEPRLFYQKTQADRGSDQMIPEPVTIISGLLGLAGFALRKFRKA